jgi:hypothetical protein
MPAGDRCKGTLTSQSFTRRRLGLFQIENLSHQLIHFGFIFCDHGLKVLLFFKNTWKSIRANAFHKIDDCSPLHLEIRLDPSLNTDALLGGG